MYHKFQRKIPTVGGRLSPWVDEEELKRREQERRSREQETRVGEQVRSEEESRSGEQESRAQEEQKDASNTDRFWPRRRKSLQVRFVII